MAERINWARLRRNVVYGAPTHPWSNINLAGIIPNVDLHKPVEALKNIVNITHPFATKIGEGAVNAAKASITNLNPIGRERLWYAGAVAGAVESLVLLPLGVSWTKGIINAGLMQGCLLASNKGWIQGDGYKAFFKGMSAGGVYGSFGLNLATDLISSHFLGLVTEEPNTDSLVDAGNGITSSSTVAPAGFPAENVLTRPEPTIATQPSVPGIPQVEAGPMPEDIYTAEAPRPTVAPAGFPAENVLTRPDIVSLPEDSAAFLEQAQSNVALDAGFVTGLPDNLPIPDLSFSAKIAKFMAENKDNAEIFTQHTVASGETAGHLLVQMDAPVTWDSMDWQGFAILHELNPDAFTDLQTQTGLSDEQFEELIAKIKAGDRAAYRELINKMGGIQAGAEITMLSKKGMSQLLSIVGSSK